MSRRSEQLLALQRVDRQIDDLRRRLEQIAAAVADELKERAAEYANRQAEAALQARQREQRELELELAAIESRIREFEQKLYSGRGSPRELQALQREIEHDRARRAEIEERVLAAMEAAEQALAERERVRAATERVLSEVAEERRRLAAEREQHTAQLERLEAERRRLAGGLDAPALALYDRLRQRLPDGIAVAEVVQNRCEGCRTALPSAEIQRARRSEAAVQCSVCGRILHVPHG
jgi:predicted  nucleic acid-binding Zn-ribbon protein